VFSFAKGKRRGDIFKLKLSLSPHVEVARTKTFQRLQNGDYDIVLNTLPSLHK